MARKASDLAARLRAAVEKQGVDRSAEEEARLTRLAAASDARRTLFEELLSFGNETGFLTVESSLTTGAPGSEPQAKLTFRFGERFLSFEADGEGDAVRIDFAGRQVKVRHRLYREEALDNRWIWVRHRGKKDDRLPLFDQGLELLLVHALDLPDPSAADPSLDEAAQKSPTAPVTGHAPPSAGGSGKKRSL